jgi:hypothetical protein
MGNIVRVVSGYDAASLDFAVVLYSQVTPAGIFLAKSLRVAEACKLTENVSLLPRYAACPPFARHRSTSEIASGISLLL